jgi:hypothetical protein
MDNIRLSVMVNRAILYSVLRKCWV